MQSSSSAGFARGLGGPLAGTSDPANGYLSSLSRGLVDG